MANVQAQISASRDRGGVPTAKAAANLGKGAIRCKKKFLRFFPGGFRDETYIDWERDYKWTAHEQWQEQLSQAEMEALNERLRTAAEAFLTEVGALGREAGWAEAQRDGSWVWQDH